MRLLGLIAAVLFCRVVSADEFFASKIEPVLREHCYECHSHKAGKMKGGLTLDARSGWYEGGDSGPAVVPGDASASLLLSALRHESFEMPPDKQLPEEIIADFEHWIDQGAADPRVLESHSDPHSWWSLRPLLKPAVPRDGVSGWSHPVDRFIVSRLAGEGLSLSAEADRRTLIRRLALDLHGLPPTAAEVAEFLADERLDAYERLVDRLLASPRYAERWSRHWLDTIHFADSHGFEHDVGREHAWPYRDYLIEALNSDKSWSQFVREQLAADAIYPEQPQLTAALGFLGAGTFDLSTFSTAPITFDYMDRDDLVTQVTAAFVSTTASCARCHDHKFDPVTQEDYYALQAVFAGVLKGNVLYDGSAAVMRQRRRLEALMAAASARQAAVVLAAEYQPQVEDWLKRHQASAHWRPLDLDTFISTDGATLSVQPEGFVLASGHVPDKDTTLLAGPSPLNKVTAIRLDVLPHESLPMQGPGRCQNGNLHLSEITVQLFEPDSKAPTQIALRQATADFNQEGWGIARAIDGDPATAWGIHPAIGQAHHAVFELSEPLALPAGARLAITLKQHHGGSHLLGAFRLSVTDASGAEAAAIPADVSAALATDAAARSDPQRAAIASHALLRHATDALADLPDKLRVYAAAPTVEVPGGEGSNPTHSLAEPKVVHVLRRGDFDKPQASVEPGGLSILKHAAARFELEQPQREAERRAALAEWIAHRDNVLTWRSAVNRAWSYHFGRGICNTPSDFGRMGDEPSHPELLDWLAVWFRDDAQGSLKQLHRLIVTSATYRQSSQHRPAAAELDGENRWLWRQNRQRLDADSFRDSVLSASGALELSMGGPAVEHFSRSKGPQVTPELNYSDYDWSQAPAARRSIYRCVWRGIADPFMEALDFPDLGLLAPRRSGSVSSLQALALYNNDFVLHHSGQLARRAEREADGLASQVRQLVLHTWLRRTDDHEQPVLEEYASRHGLPALARLLFNSNEFLFVD